MDPHIRYALVAPGTTPTSQGGLRDFLEGHLVSPVEAGVLQFARDYLTRDGKVKVRFVDADLWFQVGLTPSELEDGVLPADLVKALSNGLDRWGRPLLSRRGTRFHPPAISIITTPTEVSEVIEGQDPSEVLKLSDELASVFHRQIAAMATRRSRGPRSLPYSERVQPMAGRPLICFFPHARNRANEPDFHLHPLTFPPVLCEDGIWRPIAPRLHIRHLQWGGGAANSRPRSPAGWGDMAFRP